MIFLDKLDCLKITTFFFLTFLDLYKVPIVLVLLIFLILSYSYFCLVMKSLRNMLLIHV